MGQWSDRHETNPNFGFNRKLHKKVQGTQLGTVKLSDRRNQSTTQTFIGLYRNYQAQGALDDEKIFEVAFEQLPKSKVISSQVTSNENVSESYIDFDDLDLVGSLKRNIDVNLTDSEEATPKSPAQTADATSNEDAKSRRPPIDVAFLLGKKSQNEAQDLEVAEKDIDPKKKSE